MDSPFTRCPLQFLIIVPRLFHFPASVANLLSQLSFFLQTKIRRFDSAAVKINVVTDVAIFSRQVPKEVRKA